MARPPVPPPRPPPPDAPRKRRTAEEARHEILDAAEQMLLSAGPGGIRLQEVAALAGLSHPTVLHHFGSREGLVEAVVARALDSLHVSLVAAVAVEAPGPDKVAGLLERVFDTLAVSGHARAVLWLALEGYGPTMEQLHIHALAEKVHEIRCGMHTARHEAAKAPGSRKKPRLPSFEDTYFTVLLPALAMLSLSVMDRPGGGAPVSATDEGPCGGRRFRVWLAERIHQHLAEGDA